MSSEKKPNKITEKAGLTFNVNGIKQRLRTYYEGQALSTPKFSGSHTAVTTALEKLWEMLLQECLKKVGKDKSGVRLVNRESLQYSVLMHSGLRKYFVLQFETFDNTVEYQSPVVTVELDKVMERIDKDMALTSKARNLANFMLLKVFSQLATSSHGFIEYAKKKSLDGRSVMFAVSSLFHESVSSEINKEIARVMKEFGEELDETPTETPADQHANAAASVAAGEADNGDSEEETKETKSKDTKSKDTKSKGTKKTTTNNSKKAPTKNTKKAEAIEEEEEGDQDQESQEEEEEEEVKAAPTKSKKPVQKASTSKQASKKK